VQFDVGNAIHGGADALACMKRYPGRGATTHLKEFSATDSLALLGEGDVDWPSVFAWCESAGGVEWYIVEQESYRVPPMEAVEKCLDYLRKMGKVD